jgi:glycosyltransferase involved in cell wall biosynthesis
MSDAPPNQPSSGTLRVLLVAEQCNPEFVSVPLEGWSHGRAIMNLPGVEAHLVTQVRNREAIERAGLEHREGPGAFTAIDSEKVAARIEAVAQKLRGGSGKGWTTLMALRSISYAYFEKLVWRRFGPAIGRGEFDVVHRLTPLSPTVPCRFAKRVARAGVPLVLGPLNGGVPWPVAFDSARRAEREWLSYVRGLHTLLPGYRATRRHAAALIIGSTATLAQVPRAFADRCVYIPENAIDPARFTHHRRGPYATPLRVVFVGRLVPYKGADMLLEAAAPLLREGKLRLTVVGDGPDMPKLRGIVETQQIAQAVDLPGWVEHHRLGETLAQHDVFGFPSIREFGGAVVLEAMAAGLVPVVVGYGGPGELVSDATGFRLPIGPRAQIVAALRTTLERLAADPAQLAPMSEAARQRVQASFTWDAKAAQVAAVYRWVTGRGGKPDFGVPLPD